MTRWAWPPGMAPSRTSHHGRRRAVRHRRPRRRTRPCRCPASSRSPTWTTGARSACGSTIAARSRGRIIDLSRRAAEDLGFLARGWPRCGCAMSARRRWWDVRDGPLCRWRLHRLARADPSRRRLSAGARRQRRLSHPGRRLHRPRQRRAGGSRCRRGARPASSRWTGAATALPREVAGAPGETPRTCAAGSPPWVSRRQGDRTFLRRWPPWTSGPNRPMCGA